MNAMERIDAAVQQLGGHGTICGQHELFNQPVRDIALAAGDVGHALLFVELDDRFGEIEIDRAVLIATSIQ